MVSSIITLLSDFGISPGIVTIALILLIGGIFLLILRISIQMMKSSKKKSQQLHSFFKEARKEIDESEKFFKDRDL